MGPDRVQRHTETNRKEKSDWELSRKVYLETLDRQLSPYPHIITDWAYYAIGTASLSPHTPKAVAYHEPTVM